MRVLIYVSVASGLFFFRKENQYGLKRQYLKISNLFLIGFIIVHFQIYLDYVLGAYQGLGVDLMINDRLVPKASLISALALVMYYIGYLMASYYKAGVKHIEVKQISAVVYSSRGLLVLMVALLSLFMLTADWNYFRGNYGDVSVGTLADYAQQYLLLAMIGYVVLFVKNERIKGNVYKNMLSYTSKLGSTFLLISGVYLVLVLVSGDRGPILQFGVTYLGGYVLVAKRKMRLVVVLAGLFIGATAISLLGFVREIGNGADFWKKVEVAYSLRAESRIQSSISPSTLELAGSVRTMHAAVDYSENYGHTNGLFQLFQVLSIVPGVGTIAKALTGMENTDFKSSAFLTRHILGSNPDRGLGTTVVADIFLDFGIIGVVVIFCLFAWFVRYLEVNVFSARLFRISTLALFFIFLSQAIYIGRSTILVLFKDALLLYLIVMIGIFINSFLGYKKVEVSNR
ncbi:O-antigen polysaccharide polymerase Wzy [Owenweeksia hongkongensis]|uniref:O-antigen polysaccharide polymerase Wzy n=1 Tax=Owenweeksia hongkongensis TaxID=253245 RepID=UPI003A8D7FB1